MTTQNDSKKILSGILYVIHTGIQWKLLPDCYGKPTTVHGRFMVWAKAGIFNVILSKSIEIVVQILGSPKCFLTDTASAKAPLATFGGKNPTDRSKNGIKR